MSNGQGENNDGRSGIGCGIEEEMPYFLTSEGLSGHICTELMRHSGANGSEIRLRLAVYMILFYGTEKEIALV